MNILIIQSKAFPHRDNSFCYFYTQLAEWLTAHVSKSELFYCYLDVDDTGFENGLLLPDSYEQFYTPANIDAVCGFITDKQIDIVLDYSHVITGDTRKFLLEIRQRNPGIKIFTMIHNCPSHTTQLKTYELSRLRLKEVNSLKRLFQWMFPWLYIFLLKRVVKHQNVSAYNGGRSDTTLALLHPGVQKANRQKGCFEAIGHPQRHPAGKERHPGASEKERNHFRRKIRLRESPSKIIKNLGNGSG